MRQSKLLAAVLLLTSCDSVEEPHFETNVPEDLTELNHNASKCGQDVRWTYVERSEHCVLSAEAAFKLSKEGCKASQDLECMNWKLVRSDILLRFQGAVADSLLHHGESEEMNSQLYGPPHLKYFDGELMRKLFNDCLKVEEEMLHASGLVRIHEIIDRPLQDGQRCFRKDYPLFDTQPLTT